MSTQLFKSTLPARCRSLAATCARYTGARFQALTKCGVSLWIWTLLCTHPPCKALDEFSAADLPLAAVIYDYKPLVPDQTVRRREAGLSEAEKQDATRIGSTTRGTARGTARGVARGTARGVARGTARGVARGTARGVARGTARGSAAGTTSGAADGFVTGAADGFVTGAAENNFRNISGISVRSEIRPAASSTETPTESVYAHFEDTLYLLPDRIEPLAPRGIGYSTAAQPNLYFYINAPSSRPIEFNLLRQDALDPVVVSHIMVDPESGVIAPGIHSISLTELGVVLEPGIEYEWSITIVVDLVERSGDIVANGIVVHQPEPALQQALIDRHLPEHGVYATSGYWYDAIEVLMSLKQTEQSASWVHPQLVHWLTQEKLPSTITFLSNTSLATEESSL